MKKQLEQMETELRDLMIYQSPPELGALWTEVTEMSQVLNQRQSVALRKEMREQYEETLSRQRFMQGLALSAVWGMIVLTICVFLGIVFAFVVEDRIEKYPHLGNEWIPKTEEQRRYEQAHPKKYVGR
jgi:ABC-type spermidine/putrescine transport system permease subunit I